MIEKAIAHYFQSRYVSYIELQANTFRKASKKPNSTDISKYFEERKDQFKSPTKKIFQIGYFGFKKFADQQNIDTKLIKDYYNENMASFRTEEKRLIDILYFSNTDNKSCLLYTSDAADES